MAKSRWEIENQVSTKQKPSWPRTYLSSHANSLLTLAAGLLGFDHRNDSTVCVISTGVPSLAQQRRAGLALWVNLFRPCSADTS